MNAEEQLITFSALSMLEFQKSCICSLHGRMHGGSDVCMLLSRTIIQGTETVTTLLPTDETPLTRKALLHCGDFCLSYNLFSTSVFVHERNSCTRLVLSI